MASAVPVADNELATLNPAPKTVTVAGRAIQITCPTLRQVALYEQLAVALWSLGDQAFPDDALLMEEHPAEADAMLLAIIDVDPAWLASLPPFVNPNSYPSGWRRTRIFCGTASSRSVDWPRRRRRCMGMVRCRRPTLPPRNPRSPRPHHPSGAATISRN